MEQDIDFEILAEMEIEAGRIDDYSQLPPITMPVDKQKKRNEAAILFFLLLSVGMVAAYSLCWIFAKLMELWILR